MVGAIGRLVAACMTAAALFVSAGAATAQTKLTIMVFQGVQNLPLFAAQTKGFFARRGLEVDIKVAPTSDELRNGLAEGRYQIVHGGSDNAVAMAEIAKADIAVVCGGDNGWNQLFVQPDIASVADLRGKTVIVDAPNTSYAFQLYEMLAQQGLKKGDYQEVRMNVNDMVAAMAAKTVDAMVNVEPYNAIAEAENLANSLEDFYSFDKLPVFMAATPEFIEKNPDAIVAYLKAWLDVAKDFKDKPDKVADTIYSFYTSKGYKMSKDTFAKALARVEVGPAWPDDLEPYMKHHAEVLLAAKKIKAIPDWTKAFRKDFLKKAIG